MGRFMRWLLLGDKRKMSDPDIKWLADEELRQLGEIKTRIDRIERQIERVALATVEARKEP